MKDTPDTYNFNGLMIRVVGTPAAPLFVAKDVCEALGLTWKGSAKTSGLDEDESLTTGVIDSMGRKQEAVAVTESGLYALIFQSRKEKAKEFRKWVTNEVLPEIRKRGVYENKKIQNRKQLERMPTKTVPFPAEKLPELEAAAENSGLSTSAYMREVVDVAVREGWKVEHLTIVRTNTGQVLGLPKSKWKEQHDYSLRRWSDEDILKILGDQTLRTADLARQAKDAIGIGKSSVYRFVADLYAKGLITRDTQGRYTRVEKGEVEE